MNNANQIIIEGLQNGVLVRATTINPQGQLVPMAVFLPTREAALELVKKIMFGGEEGEKQSESRIVSPN